MIYLVLFILLLVQINGEFIYKDFNTTTGLVLNGVADFVDCLEAELNDDDGDSSIHRADDNNNNDDGKASTLHHHGYTATKDLLTTTETVGNNNNSSNYIDIHEGVFGHRDVYETDDNIVDCSERLRLTSSHPSQAASVWYESRVPVLRGFETNFKWQVTDPSIECTDHVDKAFSNNLHRSCRTLGGDGFAFVIHDDPADSSALGGDGEQLGYGGITNSIAVEFDTWTNSDSDDVFQDHISIHSAGPLLPNSSNQSTSLGYWRPYDVADGKVHEAKIQYLPYVEDRYYELMTANANLIPYLKDNGEGRQMGTLAVFVDQGIIEDRPLLAIPINLSLLLDLPDSLAYVGLTASTGRKWQKHDILSWSFEESPDEDDET